MGKPPRILSLSGLDPRLPGSVPTCCLEVYLDRVGEAIDCFPPHAPTARGPGGDQAAIEPRVRDLGLVHPVAKLVLLHLLQHHPVHTGLVRPVLQPHHGVLVQGDDAGGAVGVWLIREGLLGRDEDGVTRSLDVFGGHFARHLEGVACYKEWLQFHCLHCKRVIWRGKEISGKRGLTNRQGYFCSTFQPRRLQSFFFGAHLTKHVDSLECTHKNTTVWVKMHKFKQTPNTEQIIE